jgi:hypothetical protein
MLPLGKPLALFGPAEQSTLLEGPKPHPTHAPF